MNSRSVVYKKEYSLELLSIALEDFNAAEILFQAKVKRTENIFLLA